MDLELSISMFTWTEPSFTLPSALSAMSSIKAVFDKANPAYLWSLTVSIYTPQTSLHIMASKQWHQTFR